MQFTLTCLGGSLDGKVFALDKESIVLGRDASCDIVFRAKTDSVVSKRHCEMYQENGGFWLRDLGSKNGTYLAGNRLEVPASLRHESSFRLGQGGPEFKLALPSESRAPVLRMTCVKGVLAGQSFELGAATVTIGRAPGNTIQLDPVREPMVSSRHCEIFLQDGAFVLRDLSSKQGTLVNGVRIDSPTVIAENTVIRLGKSGPEFIIPGEGGLLRTLESESVSDETNHSDAPSPINPDSVHGSLHHLAFSSILMMLEMEKKSGEMMLVCEGQTARLFVRNGRVIQASVEGVNVPPECRSGAEAVYRVLGWSAGRFNFQQREIEMEDQISAPTTSLLMEGARRLDEASGEVNENV